MLNKPQELQGTQYSLKINRMVSNTAENKPE